jgi:hypothetical protein
MTVGVMMSERNSTGTEQESGNQGEKNGKILPFRRQAPVQPTLRRRPGATTNQMHKKNSKNSLKPALWKSRLAKGLQLGLLVVAALLALKNCGKF